MTRVAPCDWPVNYAGANCSVFEDSGADSGFQETWEALAIELLWNWTHRIFGTCPVVVRPCKVDPNEGPSTFEGLGPYPRLTGKTAIWQPVLLGGEWFNLYCGRCAKQECWCEPDKQVSLSLPGPIVEVTSVVIEGVTLDPSAYRVEQNRWLIRLDGEAWPETQNLNAAPGSPGTWEVHYTRGVAVPVGGQVAAGTLACELAKGALGDPDCGLPSRVQTVTRQGITVAVVDSFDDIKDGRTGLWSVDSWIAAVTRPRPSASVRSVDHPGTNAWKY